MSVFAPQLLTSPSWYAELEPPLPTDDAWIMEPKFDGWRFVFHVTPDGKVINYGRNGGLMDYRIPAYLVEELVRRLPPDSIIDCEVCVDGPGMQSTDVSTVLANHAKGRLTAYVFDIMRCAGTDTRSLPWIQRRYVLDLALDGKPGMFLQRSPYCEPNLDVFKQWLAIGMEGAVLKRKESPYRSGTRNNDWLKVKPQRTADCRIVALPTDGQGKYTGMVGAVEFEVAPGKIGRASGMTDAVRQDMTDHPERYLGKLAEFAYQCETRDGMFRHPQFRRLRPDLPDEQSQAPKTFKEPRMVNPVHESGWSRRNYNAMGIEKLRQVIRELEAGSGDAYDRVIAKGANPEADLAKACAALEDKIVAKAR